jgi:hypothetical protein
MTLLALLNAPSFPEAKCKDEDPDFFFPVSQVELENRIHRLKEICRGCIHQAPCRDFSIENEEEHGFWGGLTPAERNRLIKKKEAGSKRFREIQGYLSQGWSKQQVAQMFEVQVASIDRMLDRAKRKGLI